MKCVYQTRLSGVLKAPLIESYRIFAIKAAALCPGRTFFRGGVISDLFKGTLGLVKRAGASVVEKSDGTAIDGADDALAAYRIIFAGELARLPEVLSDKNFEGVSERPEGDGLEEFVFSRDVVYLGSGATEDDIGAIVCGSVLRRNSVRLVSELPWGNPQLLKSYMTAVRSLGGECAATGPLTVEVSGEGRFRSDAVILPAADRIISLFGLCCSALGFNVTVTDAWFASPYAKREEFIEYLEAMDLAPRENFDGSASFFGTEFKKPVIIDAEKAKDCLPYLLLIATQIEGTTEICNISRKTLAMNDSAFYYTVAELKKLGAEFRTARRGSMYVTGKTSFAGGAVFDCCGNPDVAVVGILATLCSKKANMLAEADCLSSACPEFWDLFKSIGGFAE